jgi:putative peptidoglycan lipid II flippase
MSCAFVIVFGLTMIVMQTSPERDAEDQPPSVSRRLFKLRYLIVAAAILHLSVTLAVFTIGRYQLLPSQIHPNGIGEFASDSLIYQDQVGELSDMLKSRGVGSWATWPNQLHVRLYSLSFAIVSRWVGFNILTIEPLNLIYYLAIVIFVFKIGATVFGDRTGLIAAGIVAVWPSFMLHTTQLLRDPLLIMAFVLLVYCLVALAQLNFSWRRALVLALAALGSLVVIRIVRLPMWPVVVGSVAASVLFFLVRSIQRKHLNKASVAVALVLVAAPAVIPKFQPFFHNQQELGRVRSVDHERMATLPIEQQIAGRRFAFRYTLDANGQPVLADDGSRIDADVKFDSPGAIVRHVPRALVVGFFAPFPNMWLHAGKQVGLSGRVISGFEMLLTYVIELTAVLGLWNRRKNLSAWLLLAVIGLGALALGLVVNNIGAMYRLRYPFWILMVILGANGIAFLYQHFTRRFTVNNNSPS